MLASSYNFVSQPVDSHHMIAQSCKRSTRSSTIPQQQAQQQPQSPPLSSKYNNGTRSISGNTSTLPDPKTITTSSLMTSSSSSSTQSTILGVAAAKAISQSISSAARPSISTLDSIYCQPSQPSTAVISVEKKPSAPSIQSTSANRRRRARSLQVPLYKPLFGRRSSLPSNCGSMTRSALANLIPVIRGYKSENDAVLPASTASPNDSEEEGAISHQAEASDELASSSDDSSGSEKEDNGNESNEEELFVREEDKENTGTASAPPSLTTSPSLELDDRIVHPDAAEEEEPATIDIVGCLTKQVAGHSALLRARGGKVCKPMDERELWFYQSLEERGSFLKKFTPAWHGCCALNLEQLGFLLSNQKQPQSEAGGAGNDVASTRSGDNDAQRPMEVAREISSVPLGPPARMQSAWSKQLSSTLEGEVAAGSKNDEPRPYIVIDDITADYQKPCILDIKMGRQEVKHSQGTTTSLYGFRVLGMMVYEPSQQETPGSYRQFDKYQGRALGEENVRSRLADFFWNGAMIRSEVVDVFLAKLKKLSELWKSKHEYKIMSGSLLFIYEGMPNADGVAAGEVKADVKMIDFQHAFRFEEVEKDDGYGWGLENLITLFEDIRAALAFVEEQVSPRAVSELSPVQRHLLRQLPQRGSGAA